METRSVDRLRRLREWARSLDFTLSGDLLLLLGPAAKVEALAEGKVAEEALAEHQAEAK